ncbi:MAG: glycosyltransferase family 2 protein [Sulfuricaulis sp.]
MPPQKMITLLPIKNGSAVSIRVDAWEWILRIAIVIGLGMIFYGAFAGKIFRPLWHAAHTHAWMPVLMRPSLLWMTMGTLLLGVRTLLWFRYRVFPSATLADAPPLTVIIPAYNEGAMVAQSIRSVAAAHYPKERLEIIVVDDGSRDDTWEHIQSAAADLPGQVTAVRFPKNRGKRKALEAGFRQARGDVVVTIDSDSVIERNTLLEITGPFRNPRIGAVAGKVSVYNQHDGLIPRMLHVRYVLSFDMLRAAQSTYGTVNCCPGALSAYRLSVVHEILDQWVAQTFLGVPSTYGEDRALTNFILSRGFDTVYQRTAVVHTVVPQTYARLCKMYLRWDRSYVREEIRFAGIVWKRPFKSLVIALLDNIITNLRYPIGYLTLGLLVTLSLSDPMTIWRVLSAIGLMSTFYMLYYLRSERSWNVVYGIFYAYYSFFTLFWVFPFAVLTVRARSWMTR